MKRSLVSCLSQGSGYAALMGVFIAQAIKPLYGILSASTSFNLEAILTDGLRLMGLLIYSVLVVLMGERIVKPLILSPLADRRMQLTQQLRAAGWERQAIDSFVALWVCLSLAIGLGVNLGLEFAILAQLQ